MLNQTETRRAYCGDINRGCGAELTEADLEAGRCTQCGEPLTVPDFPLEHALLMSLEQVENARMALSKQNDIA